MIMGYEEPTKLNLIRQEESNVKRQEYMTVCRLVDSGERQIVENRRMRYTGEVTGCRSARFEIEAFGHRAEWSMKECESTGKPKNSLGPPSNI